ncbi:hypothetical protein [Streptomyces sp. NBC_00887]|uniref:hypothetical protein n=1 Tax=Streptomyces sp. NBC_00887 TaxID=2975859 RepID=UPI003868C1B2|nr:hypothetical protein OG844_33800 [Streptomyces sp. NBC_00887]
MPETACAIQCQAAPAGDPAAHKEAVEVEKWAECLHGDLLPQASHNLVIGSGDGGGFVTENRQLPRRLIHLSVTVLF